MRIRLMLCVALVTACETPTNPNSVTDGGEWLAPIPASFADDWHAVEVCSGRTGDFASVRWIVYPDRLVIPGTMNLGQTHHDTRVIELAGLALPPVNRHEMLHLLLGPSGDSHPPEFFVEKCGELVSH